MIVGDFGWYREIYAIPDESMKRDGGRIKSRMKISARVQITWNFY